MLRSLTFFPAPFRLAGSPSFYIVYHSSFLYSFFDTREHSLHECVTDGHLISTSTAETAPLLPRASRLPCDHPIFLRVCHSPWHFISQRALLIFRMLLAFYFSVTLGLSIFFEVFRTKRGKFFTFAAKNISLLIQLIYYWITVVRSYKVRGSAENGGNSVCKLEHWLRQTLSFYHWQ